MLTLSGPPDLLLWSTARQARHYPQSIADLFAARLLQVVRRIPVRSRLWLSQR